MSDGELTPAQSKVVNVRCARCAQPIVRFSAGGGANSSYQAAPPLVAVVSNRIFAPRGTWKLAPVLAWRKSPRTGAEECEYGEPTTAAVELFCFRCDRSCGSWRARTLAARAEGVEPRQPLLVPDLPGAARPGRRLTRPSAAS